MAKHGIKSAEFAQGGGANLCAQSSLRTQYGALCWRMHRDRIEVLLITSRDTGRWVIPKGWPMDGKTAHAAAAQEAWEEAGVTGTVDPDCAGLYTYDKVLSVTDAVPCAVAVYGLRVAKLASRFPERHERRRKWFAVEKAARKVMEAELRSLMLRFVPGKAPIAKAATGDVAGAGAVATGGAMAGAGTWSAACNSPAAHVASVTRAMPGAGDLPAADLLPDAGNLTASEAVPATGGAGVDLLRATPR